MTGDQERFQRAMDVGQASLAAELWETAASAFRAAIRENGQSPAAFAGLGDALFAVRRFEKALDCYKLAGRLSHGEHSYLEKVADVLERLGELDEASRIYLAAGELYLRQRRLDDAVASWRRAVRLEPGLLGAHQRLATVYQRQGKTGAAVREYLAMARVLQARGEHQSALQVCLAARTLAPDNPDVELAIRLIREGDQEKDAPASTESLLELRRLAQDQLAAEIFRDEEGPARLDAGDASRLSKLERDALIGQGIDFQMRGRAKDAVACYERAIAGGLELPAALFTVGMLYFDLNRPSDAHQALLKAKGDVTYGELIKLVLASID